MIAYLYDSNFLYAGVTPRQKHPLKQGEYLMPANATDVAPPDTSSYTADQYPAYNPDTRQWYLVPSEAKKAQDAELLLITNEDGVALYELDVDGNPVLRPTADVEAETQQRIDSFKAGNLKATMDQNIINKAMEVTSGTSTESSQAFLSAYQLRANNPAEYVADGLTVGWAIDTFAGGDPLDTEAKITSYYTKVLVYMDKFREAEIATYKSAMAAL